MFGLKSLQYFSIVQQPGRKQRSHGVLVTLHADNLLSPMQLDNGHKEASAARELFGVICIALKSTARYIKRPIGELLGV